MHSCRNSCNKFLLCGKVCKNSLEIARLKPLLKIVENQFGKRISKIEKCSSGRIFLAGPTSSPLPLFLLSPSRVGRRPSSPRRPSPPSRPAPGRPPFAALSRLSAWLSRQPRRPRVSAACLLYLRPAEPSAQIAAARFKSEPPRALIRQLNRIPVIPSLPSPHPGRFPLYCLSLILETDALYWYACRRPNPLRIPAPPLPLSWLFKPLRPSLHGSAPVPPFFPSLSLGFELAAVVTIVAGESSAAAQFARPDPIELGFAFSVSQAPGVARRRRRVSRRRTAVPPCSERRRLLPRRRRLGPSPPPSSPR